MGSNTKYWKGLEELKGASELPENANNEFQEEIPVEEFLSNSKLEDTAHSRRDFLKFLGFSVAAATLAACEAPVIKAVPYVNKPEDVTPGIANWYASAYYDGSTFANVLVKTREGRPIFVKGNQKGFTKGATNPRIVASVLSLYDGARLSGPLKGGASASWQSVDKGIQASLEEIAGRGGKIRILSNSIMSPVAYGIVEQFADKFGNGSDASAEVENEPIVDDGVGVDTLITDIPVIEEAPSRNNGNVQHIEYDAISYSGIRKANKESFGKSVIPDYDFSKAKTVVSIGADFLATWLMANQYQNQYGETRNPEKVKKEGGWMSRHYQFEATMSITGANADYRTPVKPSEFGMVAAAILDGVGGNSGVSVPENISAAVESVVDDLKNSGDESLVVCGSNDKNVQILVNAINEKLGAYATTINLNNPVHGFDGDDEEVHQLAEDVINGNIDALIMIGVNPVYTLPNGKEFGEALGKLPLTVSTSMHEDETAANCGYVCPTHHYMESWNEFNPKENSFALAQPVIRPLFDTQAWQESLAVWAGVTRRGLTEKDRKDSTFYHDTIQSAWIKHYEGHAADLDYTDSNDFWNWMVHDGGGSMPAKPAKPASMNSGIISKAASAVNNGSAGSEGFEIQFYQKTAIGDGQMAGNPWLQEMPDPITTVTWDNYVTMNESDASSYTTDYDQTHPVSLLKVEVDGKSVKLPVIVQPGQAKGTIGIAYGYGRGESLGSDKAKLKIGKGAFATKEYGDYERDDSGNIKPIGANAFALMSFNGSYSSEVSGAKVSDTGDSHFIAATQTHHTIMGRHSIVKETSLDFYVNGWKETDYAIPSNRKGFNPQHSLPVHHDVGGARDENGRLKFDENGHPIPDDKIDANDREHVSAFDLWEEHPVEMVGHRWGMTIDLNSCFGCGSCIIACQAENNVPVVGKDEVRRVRIMHWLRIDRYYKSEVEDFVGTRKGDPSFKDMEKPAENPQVVFQPMMCQHCNHAPCETVCPVVATTHSNEGLNQMTYNRCIGTRYCANNCPYKVRRFNWFNYPSYKKFTAINPAQDDLGRMVLNPDVTVRTRGVMEKCSLCVQRIQEGKLSAKSEKRMVEDGDIETACQGACPANAIIFGDLNDVELKGASHDVEREGSSVYHSSRSDRSYQVLEEVGTKPNIFYKLKVRNSKDPLGEESMIYKKAPKGHSEEHGH